MKSGYITKTLMLAGALLFFVLTCKGQNDPSGVVGTWTKSTDMGPASLVIKADQTWVVRFTGGEDPDVYGSYTISGEQITFTDKGGAYSSDSSGVYEFTVSDGSISFKKVDDQAMGRSTLVVGDWSRAGDAG